MLSIGLSNQIAEVPNPSKYSNLYMNRLSYCNHLVHVIRYQGMMQKRQISLINNYPLCQRWFQTGQFRYRA
jgi:hypothetical protein